MAEKKLAESEFIAAHNLTLHVKDGDTSPNIEGAKEIKIELGKKIPEIFIPNFIRYNREHIANLQTKGGIPQLTKEQEKKYNLSFEKPKIKTEKDIIDKLIPNYDMENLNQRVARYIKKHKKDKGREKFKEWAEKICGENVIDRRKSCDNIIVQILK